MAKQTSKVNGEGVVIKVGYDVNVLTVMYVQSQEAMSFGTVIKIRPSGTKFEQYDPSNNKLLINRQVEFTYQSFDVKENIVNGVEFIGFKEEQ